MTNQTLATTEQRPAAPIAKAPLTKLSAEHGKLTVEGTAAQQEYLNRCLGTDSEEFAAYCLRMLVNLLPENKDDPDYTLDINAALAMLSAINPQDELEAMLAVNMVASNHMALMSMRRANNATMIQSRQMNGNLATKFSRTAIAQMDALGKHRRGGKQIVEHVHVNAGGQAVIAGTVHTGGGKVG